MTRTTIVLEPELLEKIDRLAEQEQRSRSNMIARLVSIGLSWTYPKVSGKREAKRMTFEQALKAMPRCIGGYDPLRHKTIADLVYIVRMEVDMYLEGEPEADVRTVRQYEAAKKFIAKCEDHA